MPRYPLALLLAALGATPADARPAALCDQAARNAAQETGVPADILLALTRAETGRAGETGLEPWPWAVNQAGQGYWFDSKAEAEQFVEAQLDLGYTNLDIGCFQLNLHWHAENFAALPDMFDPAENAGYAARFLLQKYQETGDWVQAAGAYHSGTDSHADRYMARFEDVLAGIGDIRLADAGPIVEVARVNAFPLLVAGEGRASNGSLMPRVGGVGSLLRRMP